MNTYKSTRSIIAAASVTLALAGSFGCSDDEVGLHLTPEAPGPMDIENGNSPGAAVTFTLLNNNLASIGLLQAPMLGGDNPENFEVVSDDCTGLSLRAGQQCTFSVRPVASQNGTYEARLAMGDGDVSSNLVGLRGEATGFPPTALLLKGQPAFPLTALNISGGASPGTAVVFTASNEASVPTLALRAPVLGGNDPGNFELLNDTCEGQALQPGASCTFEVRPLASSDGSYSATLAITDGATTSNTLTISGTASGFGGAPSLGLSPASATLDIAGGSSPGAAATFTVENTGAGSTAALQAPLLAGADPANFEVVNDLCAGQTLAPAASCTFQLQPVAAANGSYSATVSVSDGNVTSPDASIGGAAQGFINPVLEITPASSSGMDIAAGSSPGAAVTLTVTNSGAASSAALAAPQLSGTDPASFELLNDQCAGKTLAVSASCTFDVRPIAAGNGPYAASVTIGDGGVTSGPAQLAGTAAGFSGAVLELTPSAVAQMDILKAASPGAAVLLTVNNTGSAATDALQAPRLSGASVANFELLNDECAGKSLATGASCTFEVRPVASGNGPFGALAGVSDGTTRSNISQLRGGACGFPVTPTQTFCSADDVCWEHPRPFGGDLYGLFGDACYNVYAVGENGALLHFDGGRWTNLDSGFPLTLVAGWGFGGGESVVAGVGSTLIQREGVWSVDPGFSFAVIMPEDVWASGPGNVVIVGSDGFGDGAMHGGIRRFNGDSWSDEAGGRGGPGYLDAVWGSGTDDIYAAGPSEMMHFNGTDWNRTLPANFPTSASSIWGVGASNVFVASEGKIFYYNGSTVVDQPLPLTTIDASLYWGLAGRAADDVYALSATGIVMHFNGTAWSVVDTGLTGPAVPSRHPNGGYRGMNDLWVGEEDVWAVGNAGRIWRHDGSTWSELSGGSGGTSDIVAIDGEQKNQLFVALESDDSAIARYDGTSLSPSLRRLRGASNQSAGPQQLWGTGPQDLYAATTSGVAHYDGSAWRVVYDGGAVDHIWGSGSDDIYAFKAYDQVLHFDGTEWKPLDDAALAGIKPTAIWGTASDNVFIADEHKIFHFNGTAWASMTLPPLFSGATWRDFWGSAADNVYVVGDTAILKFDGTDWAKVHTMPQNNPLAAVWGSGPDDIWAVGRQLWTNRTVMVHFDGTDWTPTVGEAESGLFYDVWGSGPSDVYAAGHGALQHFNGTSWSPVLAEELFSTSQGIWGDGSGELVLIGGRGIQRRKGGSWTVEAISRVTGLRVDGTDAYALGNALLKFDGTNWVSLLSRNTADVWVGGPSNIFVIAQEGANMNRVFHFDGTDWTGEPTGGSELFGIWGSGPQDVYVVASGGRVYHNDGSDWSEVYDAPATSDLLAIWGSAADDIFAVGEGGLIAHFDGTDWIKMTSNTSLPLRAVKGRGPNDVVAVGDDGTLLHYNGTEWRRLDSGTTRDLNTVWWDANGALVAGDDQVVLSRQFQ